MDPLKLFLATLVLVCTIAIIRAESSSNSLEDEDDEEAVQERSEVKKKVKVRKSKEEIALIKQANEMERMKRSAQRNASRKDRLNTCKAKVAAAHTPIIKEEVEVMDKRQRYDQSKATRKDRLNTTKDRVAATNIQMLKGPVPSLPKPSVIYQNSAQSSHSGNQYSHPMDLPAYDFQQGELIDLLENINPEMPKK